MYPYFILFCVSSYVSLMKPQLQHLPPDIDASFVVLDYRRPYNKTTWHYHPEYEIVMVVQSHGSRSIGDNVARFKPGDISLIGPNLPHYYRNDEIYYTGDPLRFAHTILSFISKRIFWEKHFLISKKCKRSLCSSNAPKEDLISMELRGLTLKISYCKCLRYLSPSVC